MRRSGRSKIGRQEGYSDHGRREISGRLPISRTRRENLQNLQGVLCNGHHNDSRAGLQRSVQVLPEKGGQTRKPDPRQTSGLRTGKAGTGSYGVLNPGSSGGSCSCSIRPIRGAVFGVDNRQIPYVTPARKMFTGRWNSTWISGKPDVTRCAPNAMLQNGRIRSSARDAENRDIMYLQAIMGLS